MADGTPRQTSSDWQSLLRQVCDKCSNAHRKGVHRAEQHPTKPKPFEMNIVFVRSWLFSSVTQSPWRLDAQGGIAERLTWTPRWRFSL